MVIKDEDFFSDELYAESTHCSSDFKTTPVRQSKAKVFIKRDDYYLRSRKLGFCGFSSTWTKSDTEVPKKVKSVKFHKFLKKEEVAVKSNIKTSSVSEPFC